MEEEDDIAQWVHEIKDNIRTYRVSGGIRGKVAGGWWLDGGVGSRMGWGGGKVVF